MSRDARIAAALLALGLSQMIAYFTGFPALRAVAAATHAAPAPKVFSAVQGLETYSTAFFLDWVEVDRAGRSATAGDRTGDGVRQNRSLAITPELYARLEGPYNRRNVYGAVLAFGPVLATNPNSAPMFESVLRSSLCGDGAILRELGLDPARMQNVRVRLEPLRPAALGSLPRVFEPDCR